MDRSSKSAIQLSAVVAGTSSCASSTVGRNGSFGTRELQLVKGVESGNWSQNYFFAGQAQNGYRGHADAERGYFEE